MILVDVEHNLARRWQTEGTPWDERRGPRREGRPGWIRNDVGVTLPLRRSTRENVEGKSSARTPRSPAQLGETTPKGQWTEKRVKSRSVEGAPQSQTCGRNIARDQQKNLAHLSLVLTKRRF